MRCCSGLGRRWRCWGVAVAVAVEVEVEVEVEEERRCFEHEEVFV